MKSGLAHAALTALLLAGPAYSEGYCEKCYSDGYAAFGTDLSPSGVIDSTGTWTVAVTPFGEWRAAPDSLARLQLSISGGAVLDGPSQRAILPSQFGLWLLTLHRTGEGPVTISATLTIPGTSPNLSYHAIDEVVVEYESTKVAIESKREIQRLMIRDGERFRFGGESPVKLDDAESANTPDLVSRPALRFSPEVHCATCGLHEPVEIPLIVTVSRAGRVSWTRPKTGAPSAGALWDAAQEVAHGMRFSPAMSNQGPVSDYALVRARIIP